MSRGIKLGSSGISGGGGISTGKIVVDTTGLATTDTIRVQSLLDSSIIYNTTVDTPGDLIVFEAPGADYYKICLVQDVSGTSTEVVTVKKPLDIGMCLPVDVLNKTTLGGVQSILNNHMESELLSIGDEVIITVNSNPWVMQIAGINVYNDHDVMFTSKNIWSLSTNSNYTGSDLRQSAQNFYADIDNKDKQYIKQVTRKCREAGGGENTYDDYCFVLGNKETANAVGYGLVASQVQMPLFVTQANRIKTYNGSAYAYWTSDWYSGNNYNCISYLGAIFDSAYSTNYGVAPSFMLITDN